MQISAYLNDVSKQDILTENLLDCLSEVEKGDGVVNSFAFGHVMLARRRVICWLRALRLVSPGGHAILLAISTNAFTVRQFRVVAGILSLRSHILLSSFERPNPSGPKL